MHLSNELEKQLDRLNSNVKLASTIDGKFPDKYAFYNKTGRSFRTEFASTNTQFSIILFEITDTQNYEKCFARGLFCDISRLASIIDLWVDKQKEIRKIKESFNELELYQEYEVRNPNDEIDSAWTKVRNMFFNDMTFWKDADWNNRYLQMLNEAKKHKAFKNLFPFTSHYMLRFSLDKDLKETWVLGFHIIPTIYSEAVPKTSGKFYVSFNNNKPMVGQFFETAKEALDFYAVKLDEVKPVRWLV